LRDHYEDERESRSSVWRYTGCTELKHADGKLKATLNSCRLSASLQSAREEEGIASRARFMMTSAAVDQFEKDLESFDKVVPIANRATSVLREQIQH